MKKLFWFAVPILVIGVLVGWRLLGKQQQEGQLQQQAGQRRGGAASVELAVAEPREIVDTLESVGNAESPYRVQISPKSAGRIEYLELREGDAVKKGQVVLRVDPSEAQGAVLQQQAVVAQARSRLAEAQLGQGPANVGVASQIASQRAAVTSAEADLNQAKKNSDSQVAAAQASVTDASARVQSAEAAAKNAQAELSRQRANLANAQARLTRIENLYRQGFIAAQDVDDARTAVEVQKGAVDVATGQVTAAQSAVSSAQAQKKSAEQQLAIARQKGTADVAAAQARLTQARATLNVATANKAQSPAYVQNLAALGAAVSAAEGQLKQAQARLADTVLRSPIDGVVTARTADPGALASPGAPVLTVQYLDWLYVSASLPIERAGAIKEGQIASVTFDGLPGQTFSGVVTNINPAADVQSRQIDLKIKIQNPRHVVKPGMYGRISFTLDRTRAAVAVPREAVKNGPDGPTVTVVDDEGTAHVVAVTLGAQDSTRVQILSGVSPGQRVVTLAYQPVRDGQKVRLPGQGGQEKGGSQAQRPSGRP